jgi:hypothetical protein
MCIMRLSLRSSGCIVTGCGLEVRGSIPDNAKISVFYTASGQSLGPIQHPIYWVRVDFSRGVKADN